MPEPMQSQVDSIDESKARTICQRLISFFSKCKRQESNDDHLFQRFLEHLDENGNPIYSKVIETTESNLKEIKRLKRKLDASKRNQLPLQTNRLSLKKSAPSFDPNGLLIDTNLSNYKEIFAAAGHPYVVFGISFISLCDITKGIENDITD